MTEEVPIVDLTAYYRDGLNSFAARQVVQALHHAASTWGFFIITGANVSTDTQSSLLSVSKDFFNLPLRTKSDLDVREGGAAWRGYMPLGGEYTHGHLDWKEGLYVGPEHADNHHLFGLPLHGKNRFPDQALPCMRQQVLQYVGEVTELGKVLTDLFSVALSLPQNQLREKLLEPEPVVLFRIFKYPCLDDNTVAPENDTEENFGIGEHTDFGYLTILKVDSPGLQVDLPNLVLFNILTTLFKVLSPSDHWIDIPLIENSFIVNIGDMFDRITGGRYRSRPHRVQRPSQSSQPRFSFPLFFDFAWSAKMENLPLGHLPPLSDDEAELTAKRWAATTFRRAEGTWSQYLARKVQKVFPDLKLPDFEANTAPSTRFTMTVFTK